MQPKRPPEIFQLFAATTSLPGVGAKLAAVLEKRVGSYVIDVLRHLPIGLIDRRQRPALDAVIHGSIATFEILVMKHDRPAHGVRRPYRVFCQNETGELELVSFTRIATISPNNCRSGPAVLSAAVSIYFRGVCKWRTLTISSPPKTVTACHCLSRSIR